VGVEEADTLAESLCVVVVEAEKLALGVSSEEAVSDGETDTVTVVHSVGEPLKVPYVIVG
jgi:hypothetical protein